MFAKITLAVILSSLIYTFSWLAWCLFMKDSIPATIVFLISIAVFILVGVAARHKMKSKADPFFKCLVCGEYVDPSLGHIRGPDGTMHWHCHPQLKYKSDVYNANLPNHTL